MNENGHRLLLRIDAAAEMLSVSRRTLYKLIAVNSDIRAAVVEIPGVRGTFLNADRLRAAVEKMSPQLG